MMFDGKDRCLIPVQPENSPQSDVSLQEIVENLCAVNSFSPMGVRKGPNWQPLPSRAAVVELVEDLRQVLFPGFFGISELDHGNLRFHVGSVLDKVQRSLLDQIRRGICFECKQPDHYPTCFEQAANIGNRFLMRLPQICALLATDVQAAYEGDPAATSPAEAIFCYPGLMAITSYRIAHELYLQRVPLIPRIITEHAHSITGIDIHPGATIGQSFFIDHGTGIVIGETSRIGNRVRIYQGVTLGAKSFPLDELGNPIKGIDRHPVVEDDVIIYSGATILGRVTIGKSSVIGGNVWLTSDVPPNTRVTQGQTVQECFEKGAGI